MKVLIIGNGAAGIEVANTIRKKNKDIGIKIISSEKYFHYSRPRIIEILAGVSKIEDIIIKKENWYKENNIEIVLSKNVKNVVPDKKIIIYENGEEESFDKLVLANGANSFIPPFVKGKLDGVFALRTIDDALEIIDFVKDKKDVSIIGGGLLGIETGFALTQRNKDVTVIEFFEYLLPRQLDKESSDILKEKLEKKNLNFLLNKQTQEIVKENNKLKIIFKDGTYKETDCVIVSAGVRANLDIIKNTKIAYDKGIKVNEYMKTNIKDIYAAGDSTEFNGRLYGIWPAAKEQGEIAGLNIIGEKVEYKGTTMSTKLKVAGIEMASIGDISLNEEISTKIESSNNSYKKYFIKNGKIVGAILLGDTKDYIKILKTIKENK